MLVELSVVEQRYLAVREALETGATITDVAHRYGIDRRTVHRWLLRYAAGGLGALADRSSKPDRCPPSGKETHAAAPYSWIRPPRTSRLATPTLLRSPTDTGGRPIGVRRSSPRCGLASL